MPSRRGGCTGRRSSRAGAAGSPGRRSGWRRPRWTSAHLRCAICGQPRRQRGVASSSPRQAICGRLSVEVRVEYDGFAARGALALDAPVVDRMSPPRRCARSADRWEDGARGRARRQRRLLVPAVGAFVLPPASSGDRAELTGVDVTQALAIARAKAHRWTSSSRHRKGPARRIFLGGALAAARRCRETDAAVKITQLPWKLAARPQVTSAGSGEHRRAGGLGEKSTVSAAWEIGRASPRHPGARRSSCRSGFPGSRGSCRSRRSLRSPAPSTLRSTASRCRSTAPQRSISTPSPRHAK
jgi:hypothetical protein